MYVFLCFSCEGPLFATAMVGCCTWIGHGYIYIYNLWIAGSLELSYQETCNRYVYIYIYSVQLYSSPKRVFSHGCYDHHYTPGSKVTSSRCSQDLRILHSCKQDSPANQPWGDWATGSDWHGWYVGTVGIVIQVKHGETLQRRIGWETCFDWSWKNRWN